MRTKILKITFVLILGIFILPIIINFILILPTPFDLNTIGDEIEWLSFWGTYLGGIIGALVSFTILYLTLLHNKKEAEIERTNNRLLQLQQALSERLSDINFVPLHINTSHDISPSTEIERLNLLFGTYQQKMFTAKFIYENDENEFARQFYKEYSKFIILYCNQICSLKKILENNSDDMKSLIDEQVNNLSIAQIALFDSVNGAALKYFESEKEKLATLKISFYKI